MNPYNTLRKHYGEKYDIELSRNGGVTHKVTVENIETGSMEQKRFRSREPAEEYFHNSVRKWEPKHE